MTAEAPERTAVSAELYEALMGGARTHAMQAGFGWSCARGGHDASGSDRGEYTAHMTGHGAKALKPTTPKIRLRKRPAAVKMPALEVNPFKWATWTQDHTTPGMCPCGHTTGAHHYQHNAEVTPWACESCPCRTDAASLPKPATQTAERRGQYLGNAPAAHSVWVLPFEPAPWESDRAEPVQLYVGKPGRYFASAWEAKSDRR